MKRIRKTAVLFAALSLVVAVIACQGPAGPAGAAGAKGDTGAPGDDGDDGGTGPQGPMGVPGDSPLAAVSAKMDDVRLVNDITSDTEDNKVGDPTSIDVSEFFTGGIGEVTYKATQSVWATTTNETGGAPKATYTIDTDNLPTLIVTLKDDLSNYDGMIPEETSEAAATLPAVITLEATDEAGEMKSSSVRVARNKKPRVPDGQLATAPILTYRMGHQDLKTPEFLADDLTAYTWPGADNIACAKLNECIIDVQAAFEDDGFVADADEPTLEFLADPASSHVMVESHAKGIKVTGVRSTAKADGTNGAAEAVKVTVTAMDDGGLTVERFFNVVVDTQPMNGMSMTRRLPMNDDNDETTLPRTTRGTRLVTESLSAFFADKEVPAQGFTYAILMPNDKGELVATTPANQASSAHITATLSGDNDSVLNLAASSLLPDTLTVHVRATEGITAAAGTDNLTAGAGGVGQYHDITFTVVNE